ncbi:CHY zinc finger protein [Microbacterium sp. GXF0217]
MTSPVVRGSAVDEHTRCVHYNGPLDVIAIRFACCGEWYPCLRCHDEAVDHGILPWPIDQRDERAVLCGVCRSTLTIDAYLAATNCTHCAAPFNPGCALHHPVYFVM